ncbi:murein transglycosylase [Prauserella muralis]|uniref:Murein transglycosylase n=1 Tax=Prauserella muralis TaxID=588067 RepID=A0A2V4AMP0_9PSEU|nr:murein transglycosylase [Prauserella muralis]PXY21462.1 murein transglycosylase [Prauserella muralis]
MATGLTLIFTIGMNRGDEGSAAPIPVPDRRPQPHAAVPRAAVAAPVDRPAASDQAELDAWSERVAASTGVPARALAAYGRAEMWMRGERPGCHLSWGTLAGIGRVESHHGTLDGNGLRGDGTPHRPIIGVPLDGSPGVRRIADTDGGRLDGDRRWDRAVGPMQFLPSTWQRWGGRAVRDGARPDPQNIDDAALAAARYLCWNGRDLRTPVGWWDAVLTYNNSVDYARDVFSGAAAYADATRPRR